MISARLATEDDVDELVRLRHGMFAAMYGAVPESGVWMDRSRAELRTGLRGGGLAAAVVDGAGDGLAASAIGLIEQRLSAPTNPDGRVGYVISVATDPAYRRRGFSRACMQRLLDWYRQREVRLLELNATEDAEPLYASLGFTRAKYPGMRLRFAD
jgi:GNAT superfamily N-acetyltransferase